MEIDFWGVRGSFPVAAPQHMRYGGNTPCVEVTAGETTILIDAGTGVRAAGRAMLERGRTRIELLLSHSHWDHIQGLPHFDPLYREDTTITIHAFGTRKRPLRTIIADQQSSPFFPVPLDAVKADVAFIEHGALQELVPSSSTTREGPATVTWNSEPMMAMPGRCRGGGGRPSFWRYAHRGRIRGVEALGH